MEIIVVDDKSPDGTADLCEELMKVHPGKLKLLRRAGKMGLGSAYIDGLKQASGTHIILLDADLSHHPRYIPEFVKKMEETNADIVTGTRYRNEKGGVSGWPAFRHLTSQTANFVATFMLEAKNTDLTGSFRLYRREVFDDIIPKIVSKGYAFQMEIILRAAHQGYKIEEVTIIFVERIFGESKFTSKEVKNYLRGVWNLMWQF